MSLFNWFNRKPSPSQSRPAMEPSGLLNADATVPMAPGRQGKPIAQPVPPEHAANRKNERMERRELLYTVVRDAMVRAGVLSASYKFKVLSLDQRGRQFLVMMDLAHEYGGETTRLSEIEALVAQTAKTRYDIVVTAVYWRINDHVAVGIPQKGITPAVVAAPAQVPGIPPRRPRPTLAQATRPSSTSTLTTERAPLAPASPVAAAPTRPAPRFEPIEADEVAAFKRALADAAGVGVAPKAAAKPGVPVRSGPLRSRSQSPDFEDTVTSDAGSRLQDLSTTQYGELN